MNHPHSLHGSGCSSPARPSPFWEGITGEAGGKIASLRPKGVLQSVLVEPGLLLTPCVPIFLDHPVGCQHFKSDGRRRNFSFAIRILPGW